jgi:hypothetical protein
MEALREPKYLPRRPIHDLFLNIWFWTALVGSAYGFASGGFYGFLGPSLGAVIDAYLSQTDMSWSFMLTAAFGTPIGASIGAIWGFIVAMPLGFLLALFACIAMRMHISVPLYRLISLILTLIVAVPISVLLIQSGWLIFIYPEAQRGTAQGWFYWIGLPFIIAMTAFVRLSYHITGWVISTDPTSLIPVDPQDNRVNSNEQSR